jgi:hypothetical protein
MQESGPREVRAQELSVVMAEVRCFSALGVLSNFCRWRFQLVVQDISALGPMQFYVNCAMPSADG